MKKLKLVFVAIFSMVILPLATYAKEPINVYIFKSSSCSHCAEALEFFDELSKDSEYSEYFKLVTFETNGNTEEIRANVSLAEKVSKYFGNQFSGVPLIVIGEKYFEGFGSSSMSDSIKETILSNYQSDNYLDLVAGIQNGTIKGSSFDAIMSIVIVLVLVGGIGYFIYIARKGVVEDEDSESKPKKKVNNEKNKQD